MGARPIGCGYVLSTGTRDRHRVFAERLDEDLASGLEFYVISWETFPVEELRDNREMNTFLLPANPHQFQQIQPAAEGFDNKSGFTHGHPETVMNSAVVLCERALILSNRLNAFRPVKMV
jgi:hypothetical protein